VLPSPEYEAGKETTVPAVAKSLPRSSGHRGATPGS
jgi:hypothetical protein